jgi:antitoxin VapB
MKTVKLFSTDQNQVLEIPEEYSFTDEEVIINKIGDILLITPKSRAKDVFLAGAVSFTEDFMTDGRNQLWPQDPGISE